MYTYTRKARRLGLTPPVELEEIDRFLDLDLVQRFEVLRQLRTNAAHLGGGSLGVFIAVYISVVLVAIPLLAASIIEDFPVAGSMGLGLFVLVAGIVVTRSFILHQRDLARSSTRLAFFEEALLSSSVRAADTSTGMKS
ncbi:hypothetical protein [Arthrobacter sp. CAN_A1]|uniref:hypothetical protein n=1 Tax=Arthrobacter sp. CAN_A1 TaxID=2787717 RepID=UPI0018C98840